MLKRLGVLALAATLGVASPALATPSVGVSGTNSASALATTRAAAVNFDAPTRPTLVFVFAYYCNYCKQVAPHFQSIVSAMSDRMDFVMVTTHTAPSQTREFIQRHGITATVIEDPNFDYTKYKVTGYPNFLWLEPGKEFRNLGPIGYDAKTFTGRIQREWDTYIAAAIGGVENLTVNRSSEAGVFSVSWTAAVSKLRVTHYEVRVMNHTCGSVTTFGVESVTSMIRIPNYRNGCRYWVEVRAAVAGGFGAYGRGQWVEWPASNQVRCQRGKRVRTFNAKVCPTGWTKLST